MLPNSLIQPFNFDEWVSATEVCQIFGCYWGDLYVWLNKYKISSQLVAGRKLYYRPQVEAAAAGIAAMRAEREAKREAKRAAS
jgi:hypothetical protein